MMPSTLIFHEQYQGTLGREGGGGSHQFCLSFLSLYAFLMLSGVAPGVFACI
jgi:hypothetical protein